MGNGGLKRLIDLCRASWLTNVRVNGYIRCQSFVALYLVKLMFCLFLLLFYIFILSERENECEIKNRYAENSRRFSSSEIGLLNIGV